MATRTLQFPTLNYSIQLGDDVYFAEHNNNQSGKNTAFNSSTVDTKPKLLGVVTSVNHASGTILVDDLPGGSPTINGNMFFMFQKPKNINTSGITGYYAETEYRNDTTLPCEMFATAVDYIESSK